MSTGQLILLFVVPVVLGIAANLLTDKVRSLAARFGTGARRRAEGRSNAREELAGLFATNHAYATQYLILHWVTASVALLLCFISYIGIALLVAGDDASPLAQQFSLLLAVATGLFLYGALRIAVFTFDIYSRYLRESGVDQPLRKRVMNGPPILPFGKL